CITGGPQCMVMHRAVPGAAEHPHPTESITAGQSTPRGEPDPPTHSRTSRHCDLSPESDRHRWPVSSTAYFSADIYTPVCRETCPHQRGPAYPVGLFDARRKREELHN